MNELDRPLGQKDKEKQEPGFWSKFSSGPVLGILALGVSLFAVGLYFADSRRSSETTPAGETEMQTAAKSGTAGNGMPAGPALQDETQNSAASADPESAVENEDSGGNGLTELAPTGRIAVPTERPPLPETTARQESILAHLPDEGLVEKTSYGDLPKRGDDGRRPMDVYAREPDTTGNFGVARVVIIVGGIGISQTSSQQAIRDLPGSVTLAFAPYGNSLNRWMQAARKDGHELLLQVPMEPLGSPAGLPGEHTLTTGASPGENLANLHWSMGQITNYVGIMNYLGARFVQEPQAMKPVFDDIAIRGLLYVDDGTAAMGKTQAAAHASLLPYIRASVQIDQLRNRNAIAEKLAELTREAKRTGLAVGVASAFPESIELIADYVRNAGNDGVEITPVSAAVSDPERDR
jgi:polysaccharide deacetylase 2 family uncharacterized protein YibQ